LQEGITLGIASRESLEYKDLRIKLIEGKIENWKESKTFGKTINIEVPQTSN